MLGTSDTHGAAGFTVAIITQKHQTDYDKLSILI